MAFIVVFRPSATSASIDRSFPSAEGSLYQKPDCVKLQPEKAAIPAEQVAREGVVGGFLFGQ